MARRKSVGNVTDDPAVIGWALSKLPDPISMEMSGARIVDPVDATCELKWLAEKYALQLFVNASNDNVDTFLECFARFRKLLGALEPIVQQLRGCWALACRHRLGLRIEFNDKEYSSAHLCLYTWCRAQLFTIWAAVDPNALYRVSDGTTIGELSLAHLRSHWGSVRRVLDAAFQDPRPLIVQLDTELAAVLSTESGANRLTIPSEFRTRAMSKRKAGSYLRTGNPDSAVEWLNKCIEDGTIYCETLSRQSHVFDVRQFPNDVQADISPSGRSAGNSQ